MRRRSCSGRSGLRVLTLGSRVSATSSPSRMRGDGKETLVSSSPTDTLTSVVSHNGIEIRDGYAEVGDVRLHYVEAGDGPLIVLLHGFPEFWYGWRLQIEPLAAAGFRGVAPDMRGYNPSSRPDGGKAYHTRPPNAATPRLIHG